MRGVVNLYTKGVQEIRIETKQNYLQERIMLNTGDVTHTLQLVTES